MDVLFDKAFDGGYKIRSQKASGMRVVTAALLNVTYGKTRKSKAQVQQAAASVSSFGVIRASSLDSEDTEKQREDSNAHAAKEAGAVGKVSARLLTAVHIRDTNCGAGDDPEEREGGGGHPHSLHSDHAVSACEDGRE